MSQAHPIYFHRGWKPSADRCWWFFLSPLKLAQACSHRFLLHGQDKHGFILRTWIYLETHGKWKWRWINFGNILKLVKINIEIYWNWNRKFTTLVKVLCPLALGQYIWYSFDFGQWGADSTRNTNHSCNTRRFCNFISLCWTSQLQVVREGVLISPCSLVYVTRMEGRSLHQRNQYQYLLPWSKLTLWRVDGMWMVSSPLISSISFNHP